MKTQLWICLWFLFDFVLEFFLSRHKGRYLRTHFIFLFVAIPYQNIIAYYGWTFSPEVTYLLRFIPLLRGGYALAIVVGWLTYNRASSLFVSYLTMLLATVYFSSLAFFVLEHKVNPLWGRFVVGFYGRDYCRVKYYRHDDYRKSTFRIVGSSGDDDVPDFYSLYYEPDSAIQQAEEAILRSRRTAEKSECAESVRSGEACGARCARVIGLLMIYNGLNINGNLLFLIAV